MPVDWLWGPIEPAWNAPARDVPLSWKTPLPTALFAKLRRRHGDTDHISAAIEQQFSQRRQFAAGQEVVARGAQALPFSLIKDGWAARYKLLPNGRRQITAIMLPGDFIDLQRLGNKPASNGIVALTPLILLSSSFETANSLQAASPAIAALLWEEGMIEHAIMQEWLVAMGRRSAVGHMAHLVCELIHRQLAAERVRIGDAEFPVPLTQGDLADVLGLSIVHVNRVLRVLRHENVATWTNQTITRIDFQKLQAIASFDPAYLGLPSLGDIHTTTSGLPQTQQLL